MKWKRASVRAYYHWYVEGEDFDAARVTKFPELQILRDPRTGKPWKTMKAAREWYDSVTGGK